MKLLHLDSSILGDNSVSRTLSAAVVARLRETSPGLEVTYRDVAADLIPHLSGAYLAGQSADVQHDQAMQENLALGGRILEEFLAADIVVIGVALYNFTVPETYLRTVFGFIGITNLEVIVAEGLAFGPEPRRRAVEAALERIAALPAAA